MKILHYMGAFHFGGIEKMLFDLASKQAELGESVCVAVGQKKGEFIEQFENKAFTVQVLNINSGYSLSIKKYREIKRIFQDFEIIHLHEFHLLIALVCFFSSKKIVYTEHGNFAFGRKIKFSDKLSFWLRKLFFKFSEVQICANSDFTKNYIEKHFYSGKRLETIHNGINLQQSINEKLLQELKNQHQGKFVVGTSSRLVGFKHIDRLIDVFSEFVKRNPNSVLLIVGDGPEKGKLEKKVLALVLKEKCFFYGFQSEVATFQSFFDVCVFPSENEPFGLVSVECLNLGKPVLVFENGGGLTEIISRFNPDNICINESKMLERLEFYQNTGNNNPVNKELLDYFSVQRMTADYMQVYSKKR